MSSGDLKKRTELKGKSAKVNDVISLRQEIPQKKRNNNDKRQKNM
jgi:hypothetical protein